MMNEHDNNAIGPFLKRVRRVVKCLVVRRIEYVENLKNSGFDS